MMRLAVLSILLARGLWAWTGTAADLAAEMRAAGIDRDECYKVRDLAFTKEDLRFYLTDGYLAFGKAVDGHRRSAVFLGEEEAGDAEMLLFPPNRTERMSLAKATESPNLNEHFRLAVMVFSDDTYEALLKQIRDAGEPRKSPEMAALLEPQWESVIRNLTTSFLIRLVQDSLEETGASQGFFFATIRGEKLGNFDVLYDPRRLEQVVIGRVAERGGATYFDTWTSFESRSFRNKSRSVPDAPFRLSNFRLDAVLEPNLTLKVATKVSLTPADAGLRALEFSMSPRMRLTAATFSGVPAEVFQRDSLRESLLRDGDSSFLLIPPSPLERGKTYEVEFQSDGIIIQSSGNNVYYVGSRENWYPNQPSQFATYDVRFRYPKDLDLVVAGDAAGESEEGNYKVTHRRITAPVRYLGFNLGQYEHVNVSRGPYRIEVYANKTVEPGLQKSSRPVLTIISRMTYDPIRRTVSEIHVPVLAPAPSAVQTPQLQQFASEIAGTFEFMAGKFGPPPVRTLTVSPIPGSFGQGFPGLLYVSTTSYLRPEERPAAASGEFQQTFFSDILHAHEIAHQWWGNAVATSGWQDAWLMEALANYSALLYVEKRRGAKALDFVLGEYRKRLLAQGSEGRTNESTGPITWGGRLRSSEAPDAWQSIVYEKGSWILHMLRGRLGDERFNAMLMETVKRYNRSLLTTDQFRQLAAKFLPPGSADPNLDVFFQNWVYSTGIPTLQMQSTTKGKVAPFVVSGTIKQSGVDDDFAAWVPVEVQFKNAKPVVQWVKTDSEPARFSMTFKQLPARVVLDPADSILSVKK